MKVKIIHDYRSDIEKLVNDFIENKEVINISFTRYGAECSVLIMYEERR